MATICSSASATKTTNTSDGRVSAKYPRLTGGEARGLGAELRLLGLDPEAVEQRARRSGAKVVKPVTERGHGWREVMVEDPDGYVWAVGVLSEPNEAK